MKRNVIIELISGLIALLFVYAATSKILDHKVFRLQLSQSPFITSYAGTIFWLLPAVELCIAVLLVFYSVRLYALYASLFLLTLFTAYLIAMLRFSYYVPCSCGGVLASLSWKQHVVLNIAFILLSVTGIILTSINKPANAIIPSS